MFRNTRIKHALSDKINTGYISNPNQIYPDREDTEASNLFKHLGRFNEGEMKERTSNVQSTEL